MVLFAGRHTPMSTVSGLGLGSQGVCFMFSSMLLLCCVRISGVATFISANGIQHGTCYRHP